MDTSQSSVQADSDPLRGLLRAIEEHDVPSLRSALEDQDRLLLSTCARTGTPEAAHYLLSRLLPLSIKSNADDNLVTPNPAPEDAYLARHIPNPSPTHDAPVYLLKESARTGNVAVFRSLAAAYPKFLTMRNRNIESLLVNAIEGGVSIWKVILSHEPRFVSYEFHGHGGCLLEVVVRLGGLTAYDVGRTSEQSKESAWETFKYLLEQGPDLERAGDPVLENLKSMKAEERVIELLDRQVK